MEHTSDLHTEFDLERNRTFDLILAGLRTEVASHTGLLIERLNDFSVGTLNGDGRHEVLQLFTCGIQHLKDGAPGGKPGTLTAALTKASLRSGAFAAAIGIKPPQFEQTLQLTDLTSGYDQAIFLCRRLREAATADFLKSRQMIERHLQKADTKHIYSSGASIDDFDTGKLKRQLIVTFNGLCRAYEEISAELRENLESVPRPNAPTPPARPTSGRFTLQ